MVMITTAIAIMTISAIRTAQHLHLFYHCSMTSNICDNTDHQYRHHHPHLYLHYTYRYLTMYVCLSTAWVHLRPRWPGRCPDRQCLLGAVLPGARYPAWRPDALRQDHRRRRRLLQHLLQRDRRRQARASRRLRRPGAHRRWSVAESSAYWVWRCLT